MMSDVEKAMLLEEVEESNFGESLKEAFIDDVLYPERGYLCHNIDEFIALMKKWDEEEDEGHTS